MSKILCENGILSISQVGWNAKNLDFVGLHTSYIMDENPVLHTRGRILKCIIADNSLIVWLFVCCMDTGDKKNGQCNALPNFISTQNKCQYFCAKMETSHPEWKWTTKKLYPGVGSVHVTYTAGVSESQKVSSGLRFYLQKTKFQVSRIFHYHKKKTLDSTNENSFCSIRTSTKWNSYLSSSKEKKMFGKIRSRKMDVS